LDRNVGHIDTQYMLGSDLLVAPVFTADGSVDFYLPEGLWTNYFTGEQVRGPVWRSEQHGFDTVPLYVREGAVLPIGNREDVPDYDYLDGLSLEVYPSDTSGRREVTIVSPTSGRAETFTINRTGASATISATTSTGWSARLVGGTESTPNADGVATL
jgi:alpha-D-xyloside xylohydrolase